MMDEYIANGMVEKAHSLMQRAYSLILKAGSRKFTDFRNETDIEARVKDCIDTLGGFVEKNPQFTPFGYDIKRKDRMAGENEEFTEGPYLYVSQLEWGFCEYRDKPSQTRDIVHFELCDAWDRAWLEGWLDEGEGYAEAFEDIARGIHKDLIKWHDIVYHYQDKQASYFEFGDEEDEEEDGLDG